MQVIITIVTVIIKPKGDLVLKNVPEKKLKFELFSKTCSKNSPVQRIKKCSWFLYFPCQFYTFPWFLYVIKEFKMNGIC